MSIKFDNLYPFKGVLRYGKSQKAHWAISGEYEGWSKVVVKFLDTKFPDSEFVIITGIVISPNEENADLFLDQKDIVHFEYLEEGQTVDQHCYLEILVRLHEAFLQTRTEIWPDACILHPNNTFAIKPMLFWSFW